jgi:hypothetical protein
VPFDTWTSTRLAATMSKKTAISPVQSRRPPSRFLTVLTGVGLGAVWGSVMWLIFEATGQDTGARGWIYLALTTAMIGGGVAAFFGATGARMRGERVGPRLRLGRRGRGR